MPFSFITAACGCCVSCGTTQNCCANCLPTTLTASFSDSHLCSCATGSCTLTWDGTSKWTGTWSGGSCAWGSTALAFYCVGTDATGFRLDFTPSGAGCSTLLAISPLTSACSPLSVVFRPSDCGCVGTVLNKASCTITP